MLTGTNAMPEMRDLRLEKGAIDPELHIAAVKDARVVQGGDRIELHDLTASKLELYDSVRAWVCCILSRVR